MSSLLDIASVLTPDDIPSKLKCAICSKLAWNAFKLPCCEQPICENCQPSLPSSCPVCDHSPVAPELCKPNKALRTTLKAFLRTEEKKREREKPTLVPAPEAVTETPQENETAPDLVTPPTPAPVTDVTSVVECDENPMEVVATTSSDTKDNNTELEKGTEASGLEKDQSQPPQDDDQSNKLVPQESSDVPQISTDTPTQATEHADPNNTEDPKDEVATFGGPESSYGNGMASGMGTNGYGQMGWGGPGNFNQGMQQFMQPGMAPVQNLMGNFGMPAGMGMDPFAMAQGMYSDYGMNMNGMDNEMNLTMNFNGGQGMYGVWDGQNNMWNGGPDNYNGIAFPNRMDADLGPNSGVGGYNMSHLHPNLPQTPQHSNFASNDYQSSYSHFGRGGGRGRGFYQGNRGRGGYYNSQGNYAYSNQMNFQRHNSTPSQHHQLQQQQQQQGDVAESTSNVESETPNTDLAQNGEPLLKEVQPSSQPHEGVVGAGDKKNELNDIPPNGQSSSTNPIDPSNGTNDDDTSVHDHANPIPSYTSSNLDHEAPGRFRPAIGIGQTPNNSMPNGSPIPSIHGSMHVNGARGPGVVGAPAAPRAMREGLSYAAGRNSRSFPAQGRSRLNSQSIVPESRSSSVAIRAEENSSNQPRRSRSSSRSSHHHSHTRSLTPRAPEVEERRKDRSSKRSHREEYEKRSSGRERHRTKARSRSRSRSRSSVESRTRTHSHRSKRDRERTTTDKPSSSKRPRRHRSRTPSRRGHEGTDRAEKTDTSSLKHDERRKSKLDESHRSSRGGEKSDRQRHRERDRDHDRDRHHDRKRSRRDLSTSHEPSEYPADRYRRARHDESHDRSRSREKRSTGVSGSTRKDTTIVEKDAHTLEREARNRERLLKEQQRREAVNADRDSRSRRESKPERNLLGRKFSYQYEDEIENQQRTAQVEREREAARWA
ncbi:hypothetical protein FQN57_005925 [Myotisia sp. PD_48]|nr:hypothetical protein FQN57_005925 [Myotisia sp. PD_48]